MDYCLSHDVIWLTICTTLLILRSCNASEFCPLMNDDCSQNGIHCKIERIEGCSYTWPEDDVTHYPAPVTSMTIEPYYRTPVTEGRSESRIDISWGLPENGTHIHLQGFEVRFVGENPYCFLFKFDVPDQSVWQQSEMTSIRFNMSCEYLYDGDYTIQLTSLPESPPNNMSSLALLSVIHKYRDKEPDKCSGASCYDTDIVIHMYDDLCSSRIVVCFAVAPDETGITTYDVALTEKESFVSETGTKVTKMGSETFLTAVLDTSSLARRLPMENVVVKVWASCGQCRASVSQAFDLIQPTPDECTFTVPPEEQELTPNKPSEALVAGMIVLGIACAGALTAGLIFVRTRRRPALDQSLRKPVVNPVLVNAVWGQKIYLLYGDNSHAHLRSLDCFRETLVALRCEIVNYQPNQCDLSWDMTCLMLNSDRIILVNCPMFGSLPDIGESNPYKFGLSALLSDLMTPDSLLREKVVFCHFAKTLPNSAVHQSYSIPDQLDDLIRLINPPEIDEAAVTRARIELEQAVRRIPPINDDNDWSTFKTSEVNSVNC